MKQTQKPKFYRRKYFINPKFQGSFIQLVIGIALLINLILYATNIFIFFKFNLYGETLDYESKQQFYSFFQDQISLLNQSFLIVGTIIFAIIFVFGLLVSHKVAGPLYNLTLQLKKLQSLDDLNNIHHITGTQFRKTDFFHEIATEYNKALTNIQQLQWNALKEKKNIGSGPLGNANSDPDSTTINKKIA